MAAPDPRRPGPPPAAMARLDHARRSLRCVRDELRRCERLGLETPLARAHEQVRYWTFVSGLLALTETAAGGPTWPAAR